MEADAHMREVFLVIALMFVGACCGVLAVMCIPAVGRIAINWLTYVKLKDEPLFQNAESRAWLRERTIAGMAGEIDMLGRPIAGAERASQNPAAEGPRSASCR